MRERASVNACVYLCHLAQSNVDVRIVAQVCEPPGVAPWKQDNGPSVLRKGKSG